MRTGPQPQSTRTKKFVKLRPCGVFEICERTDKQTDILVTMFCTSLGADVVTKLRLVVTLMEAANYREKHLRNVAPIRH